MNTAFHMIAVAFGLGFVAILVGVSAAIAVEIAAHAARYRACMRRYPNLRLFPGGRGRAWRHTR